MIRIVWCRSDAIGGFDAGEFVGTVEAEFGHAFAGLRFIAAGGELGSEVLDVALCSISSPATGVILVQREMLGDLDDVGVGVRPCCVNGFTHGGSDVEDAAVVN